MVWSPKAEQLVRRLMAEHPPDIERLRQHSERLGALFAGWDLWSCRFLRPNGEVVTIDEDWTRPESEVVYSDRSQLLSTISAAARFYPEIAQLLPEREPGAVDCMCVAHPQLWGPGKMICSECGGVGWLPASSPTESGSVPASERSPAVLPGDISRMDLTADQFAGCMLGLATGDALGAPHEGGPIERLVWRLIGKTSDGCLRWTDDTQMALDLAESLLVEGKVCPDALARQFASSYRWSRGYGRGAARTLKRIRQGQSWQEATKAVYAEGSYGNGAAMRAPVLALFFARDRYGLLAAARSSARVTHAHPLGVKGAVLIALASHALLEGQPATELLKTVQTECFSPGFSERIETVRSWIESKEMPSAREVAKKLGNGITAPTSCPTALYIALRHRKASFDAMMEFVIACRGDVDTIGAMAGALWGIANGAERLPAIRLEDREALVDVAMRMFRRYEGFNDSVPSASANGGDE